MRRNIVRSSQRVPFCERTRPFANHSRTKQDLAQIRCFTGCLTSCQASATSLHEVHGVRLPIPRGRHRARQGDGGDALPDAGRTRRHALRARRESRTGIVTAGTDGSRCAACTQLWQPGMGSLHLLLRCPLVPGPCSVGAERLVARTQDAMGHPLLAGGDAAPRGRFDPLA